MKSKMNFKTMKKSSKDAFITYAMVVIVYLIIQAMVMSGSMSSLMQGMLVPLCTYSIVAIGLNLCVGYLGELSLGHAGFMCVGAFSSAFFTKCMEDSSMNPTVRFIIALLIGIVFAAFFGFLIGIPVLRLRGDYLAIVTLAFGEIIKNVMNVLYVGRDSKGFHFSIKDATALNMDTDGELIVNGAKGITGTPHQSTFTIGVILIILSLIVVYNLVNSRSGRAIMAIRDNRIAAESVGINVTKFKLMSFTISAAIAGAGGVLYAHNLSTLTALPANFGYNMSIMILVFVVLGGIGNIRGSIIAAVILTLLPELLRGLSDYRMLIYSVLLIAMMLFNWAPGARVFRERMKSKLKRQRRKHKMALLEVKSLGISFGGLRAVDDFNLKIEKGQLYGLIGPNGAGKTTVFNMLTGVYKPTDGSIFLDGENITGKKTIDINKHGIARTFQNIRLFHQQSVIDNVKIGLHNEHTYSTLSGILRLPSYRKTEKIMNEKAMELLEVFDLQDEADILASNLPYGKQRKLEIARALATDPKLLLLDEPAAGMNPNETKELMETIRFVRDKFDMTVLLIEHDMKLVSGICEELTVLNFGQVLAQGKTSDVLNNPEVIKAYLGE